MKRIIVLAFMAWAITLVAGNAMADSIAGRFGMTGRIGFLIPADNDFNDRKLETDAGFVGGGGFIYGIDKNLAAEIDVTRTEFGSNLVSGPDQGDFGITNISLGVQYRFMITPQQLVPYAGGGLDILLNDYKRENRTKPDVDTVVGVHLAGGIDYFVLKQLALNAEAKAVIAPEADINQPGNSGHFDPSSFSGTFGVRLFFN
ncbi:MAG: outer membrane [Geobacteraceae bacterium]|nr:MAG: outer membrane [Geobacteraceae bacterium]